MRIAIYTSETFATGDDTENRAAVRGLPTVDLDLVGLAPVRPAAMRTLSCAV